MHPLGLSLQILNGVKSQTLEPIRGIFAIKLQLLAYEQKVQCCLHLLFFEPGICERRLTLDLHHKADFTTLSKPLMPRVVIFRSYTIIFVMTSQIRI